MFRNALFASVIALGVAAGAGAAHAQAPDVTGHAPVAAGNVGGGGVASIAGGGDDMTITYAAGGAGAGQMVLAQPPRLARARNGTNGSLSVEYLEPETAQPGREAWLVGSGDDAEVVYRNPH
jgi:hypothetical protein